MNQHIVTARKRKSQQMTQAAFDQIRSDKNLKNHVEGVLEGWMRRNKTPICKNWVNPDHNKYDYFYVNLIDVAVRQIKLYYPDLPNKVRLDLIVPQWLGQDINAVLAQYGLTKED